MRVNGPNAIVAPVSSQNIDGFAGLKGLVWALGGVAALIMQARA
jgi:hypothetical protein